MRWPCGFCIWPTVAPAILFMVAWTIEQAVGEEARESGEVPYGSRQQKATKGDRRIGLDAQPLPSMVRWIPRTKERGTVTNERRVDR